jgi:hypothetical protein
VSHVQRLTVLGPEWRGFISGLDLPAVLRILLLLPYIAPLVIALLIRLKSPLGPVAHAMTQLSLTPTLITGPQKDNGKQ